MALVSIYPIWQTNNHSGDPGEGKTTLVLNIAAVLSKGQGLDETYESGTAAAYYLPDGRRWLG